MRFTYTCYDENDLVRYAEFVSGGATSKYIQIVAFTEPERKVSELEDQRKYVKEVLGALVADAKGTHKHTTLRNELTRVIQEYDRALTHYRGVKA